MRAQSGCDRAFLAFVAAVSVLAPSLLVASAAAPASGDVVLDSVAVQQSTWVAWRVQAPAAQDAMLSFGSSVTPTGAAFLADAEWSSVEGSTGFVAGFGHTAFYSLRVEDEAPTVGALPAVDVPVVLCNPMCGASGTTSSLMLRAGTVATLIVAVGVDGTGDGQAFLRGPSGPSILARTTGGAALLREDDFHGGAMAIAEVPGAHVHTVASGFTFLHPQRALFAVFVGHSDLEPVLMRYIDAEGAHVGSEAYVISGGAPSLVTLRLDRYTGDGNAITGRDSYVFALAADVALP